MTGTPLCGANEPSNMSMKPRTLSNPTLPDKATSSKQKYGPSEKGGNLPAQPEPGRS